MEDLKFRVSKSNRIIYILSFIMAANIWFLPFFVIWIGRDFNAAYREYFLEFPEHPFVVFVFSSFSMLLVLIRIYNGSLRYPIVVNRLEIMQKPWLGGWRHIQWSDVKRIQIFHGMTAYGQGFYRLRIFSNSLVIVISNELERFDNLLDFIKAQISDRNIPIYEEAILSNQVMKFGSWDIDSAGKSAGVAVTRIETIPMLEDSRV